LPSICGQNALRTSAAESSALAAWPLHWPNYFLSSITKMGSGSGNDGSSPSSLSQGVVFGPRRRTAGSSGRAQRRRQRAQRRRDDQSMAPPGLARRAASCSHSAAAALADQSNDASRSIAGMPAYTRQQDLRQRSYGCTGHSAAAASWPDCMAASSTGSELVVALNHRLMWPCRVQYVRSTGAIKYL
jgi:hypothetical protein